MTRPPLSRGGGTPLYKPKRVGICAALVRKDGYRICAFGIWIRVHVSFQRNNGSVRTYFFVSISNEKKEGEVCEFQFCCCSNQSNDDIILKGQVLEWVWVLETKSENGCEK